MRQEGPGAEQAVQHRTDEGRAARKHTRNDFECENDFCSRSRTTATTKSCSIGCGVLLDGVVRRPVGAVQVDADVRNDEPGRH